MTWALSTADAATSAVAILYVCWITNTKVSTVTTQTKQFWFARYLLLIHTGTLMTLFVFYIHQFSFAQHNDQVLEN